jgi:hypothetical protein
LHHLQSQDEILQISAATDRGRRIKLNSNNNNNNNNDMSSKISTLEYPDNDSNKTPATSAEKQRQHSIEQATAIGDITHNSAVHGNVMACSLFQLHWSNLKKAVLAQQAHLLEVKVTVVITVIRSNNHLGTGVYMPAAAVAQP